MRTAGKQSGAVDKRQTRQMTQRQRARQRKRRRIKYGIRMLGIALLCVVIAVAVRAIRHRGFSGEATDALQTVKNVGIADPFKGNSEYPARMLEALENNEELLDFVAAYPEKKGTWEESPQLHISGDRLVPLFLQWDERWGYAPYGDGMIGLDGCGPTCLSMVYVGLTGDVSMNPKAMADYSAQNGYLNDNGATEWALMTQGAQALGLTAYEVSLDETAMSQELAAGHPIICSVREGDFTTKGHFIVLYDYRDSMFYVNDPNSRKRSDRDTGYSFARLMPQIKALWAYAYTGE